jgi:hypothetical protein
MAQPGHHPGVFMALALPRTRLRPSVSTRAPAGSLAGRGGCGRGVARRNTFLGQRPSGRGRFVIRARAVTGAAAGEEQRQ